MTYHPVTATLLAVLTLVLLAGCGQGPDYTETGDLEALQERGVLRLAAPRFDEEQALVREGVPLQEFREQAEAAAEALGLEPRWVYTDGTGELADLLNEGRADMIVSNYSVTEARGEAVAFCTPVAVIDEYLVVPDSRQGDDLAALGAMTLAVPEGTAYAETAEELAGRFDTIKVETLPGDTSDAGLLEAVAEGRYGATIVDGNMLESLLLDYDGLRRGPVVKERRRIAWAVRQDNPVLRAEINEFIVSHHVSASVQTRVQRDWAAIKEEGVLRVITSNNPASYFLWRGELMGFDYDLIRHFAKQHGLRVRMVVRNSASEMFQALEDGAGDVIAASMTVTEERRRAGWHFSKRYLEVHEQIIGPADEEPLESVEALAGRTVAVAADSAFVDSLERLRERGIDVTVRREEGATSEMLIQQVADGELDLTLVDSHLAALESTYRDDIQPLWTLEGERDIAWGLRANQPGLKKQLDAYISRHYKGLFYNVTFNRYFKEPKTIRLHEEYRVEAGKEISPYDDLVKEYALKYGFDWRLVVSQMYQESRFNPDARSFAGAQGLMQVMPRTARQFGFSDPHDPEQGIAAGMAYLQWLEDRFPQRLELAQKLYFGLAAYNAGAGHVEDARRLAQRLGKDPDVWFDNVETAMLLLSRPQYARQARFGYVRGSEPVKYVREIRNRYLGYVEFTVENNISAQPE
ncbi:transporter substrate-binding domain-containing protein [Alcanivorax marinus]|uniref:Transporter substrate-binding domain-containing protein n=1 Tax=Alloalcanivorax marinus TaxID=1177169 RepID=A0A9Q3UN59_9GAMM|nr:transporter substrate-binding domain-containing protein [Alloalcanivorax marinus]MCC4308529.1 transporter substrate-binding domain-containing protein [Alloalcanivorax marinus]MCU5785405.1 ligand-binding/transglycosylase domain-containing protein [Alloalcanivorax marinus]